MSSPLCDAWVCVKPRLALPALRGFRYGIPVLGFYRSHTLYHCYGVARSPHDGLHHIQFTVKDPTAVYAAYDKMKQGGQAKLIWGPLRHGADRKSVV